MWSGVPREWAQLWADRNDMQTLTTAMGPLMDTKHPSCLKSCKSAKAWKEYVKGASGLFADCLPKGNVVTVVSRPPPQRLNPEGISTYQIIEEPILKGAYGGVPVSRIDMVHVGIEGAENYRYQVWPRDQKQLWVEKYGLNRSKKHFKHHRKVYVYKSAVIWTQDILIQRDQGTLASSRSKLKLRSKFIFRALEIRLKMWDMKRLQANP